jgi:4-hydroxy-tetrahydrodipicolinate synthase
MMVLGGDGGILAVAHIIGKEYREMIKLCLSGNINKAREIHFKTLQVVKALFIETNPVPVKEAMAMMGLPAGNPRLPLVPLKAENREVMRQVLIQSELLKG